MDENTVFQGFARALLAIVLVAGVASVSACKDSGEGNAQAKAPEAEKAADAIPVEVARASRQAVAASYTGTGALDARAESQVVAKTSGIAMEVFAEEGDHVEARSEEHTSELQSLMRISYAVFCLKKKKETQAPHHQTNSPNTTK